MMLNRRTFLCGVIATVLSAPVVAEAQPPIRIGATLAQTGQIAATRFDRNTVFGRFKVDRQGAQIAHKMLLFQWQDGKKVIVWPDELAPDKPRFPTPPWSERR